MKKKKNGNLFALRNENCFGFIFFDVFSLFSHFHPKRKRIEWMNGWRRIMFSAATLSLQAWCKKKENEENFTFLRCWCLCASTQCRDKMLLCCSLFVPIVTSSSYLDSSSTVLHAVYLRTATLVLNFFTVGRKICVTLSFACRIFC